MPRATENTIWTTARGATWCEAAHGDGSDEVVVLVGHITDGGEPSVTVLSLDAEGKRREGAELTLPDTSAYLATVVVSKGRATLGLASREEEERDEGSTVLHHDHPVFLDLGKRPWKARVVARRDDLDVSHMAAARHGDEIAWVFGLVAWNDAVPATRLGFGRAQCGTAPNVVATEISCASVAHVATKDGSLALVATTAQADLWSLGKSGPPQKVLADVAVAKNRRKLSSMRISRLRDGLLFAWYVTPNGSYDAGGGLFARTASTELSDVGPVVQLARVDEAAWDEWRVDDVGDGALVLFGSGEAGDRPKQLRVRERADIEGEARTIPGKLPVAVAVTRKGVVAVTAKHSGGGRKATLVTRLLTL